MIGGAVDADRAGGKADHQPYYGARKSLLEDHAEHLAKAINHRQ